MNRRGSLEWSLETVGKLIFYALILVALIYMSMKLVEIFTHGEQDWRAKQNLKYLGQQAEVAIKEGKASVIVNPPINTVFVSFNKDQERADFEGDDNWVLRAIDLGSIEAASTYIERPKTCKDACICAFRLQDENDAGGTRENTEYMIIGFGLVQCTSLKADSIRGEIAEVRLSDGTFLGRDLYVTVADTPNGKPFVIDGSKGPIDFVIEYDRASQGLTLTPATP